MPILNPEITVFLADIGYLVKLLSNHYATLSPKNLENISNSEGWSLTLVAYLKKNSVLYLSMDYKAEESFLSICIIQCKEKTCRISFRLNEYFLK